MTEQTNLQSFLADMSDMMGRVNTRLQRDQTMHTRVSRRYSMSEVGSFLQLDLTHFSRFASNEPLFPEGKKVGRERTFSPDEIMFIRALMASNKNAKKQQLFWREPDDKLTVICCGAQKGGTGKSLTAAHLAQYLNLQYGLRVGIIDSDPQATATLYFADERISLFDPDVATVADFMGASEPEAEELADLSPEDLNDMWLPTAWPATRIIPGGPGVQDADISLFFLSQKFKIPVYRVLRDAISKWENAYSPKTKPKDLRNENGEFDLGAYQEVLDETLDVIIIDQQPSLTVSQLNGLLASDTIIIPQTMKGLDLSTLTSYVENLGAQVDFVADFDQDMPLGQGRHVVLPSIVQEANEQDINQIFDLFQEAPEWIAQVWYSRSDAIANASEEYKSIYEYQPTRNKRKSAQSFSKVADAVNDYLVGRALPHLPGRGYARAFIEERWTEEYWPDE